MFGLGGMRGGRGGDQGAAAAGRQRPRFPGQENREPTAVEKAAETLNTTLENQSASAEHDQAAAHRSAGGPREGQAGTGRGAAGSAADSHRAAGSTVGSEWNVELRYGDPMNALVHRMLDQGLIDESAARGISGLLAKGEPPTRAFAVCGVAEEPLLRFLARELGLPFVELEPRTFTREFLAQFPARILLDKHIMPVEGEERGVAGRHERSLRHLGDRRAAPGHGPGLPDRPGARWRISTDASSGIWASGPTPSSR